MFLQRYLNMVPVYWTGQDVSRLPTIERMLSNYWVSLCLLFMLSHQHNFSSWWRCTSHHLTPGAAPMKSPAAAQQCVSHSSCPSLCTGALGTAYSGWSAEDNLRVSEKRRWDLIKWRPFALHGAKRQLLARISRIVSIELFLIHTGLHVWCLSAYREEA